MSGDVLSFIEACGDENRDNASGGGVVDNIPDEFATFVSITGACRTCFANVAAISAALGTGGATGGGGCGGL